ncbi:MAG TPA: radical SAM protein [Actinocrinis sp.]|uniref:radical SAM protein n=1 Tax=Actinocrinis sp. TaxID=1920516 RepID=UPI002DDD2444|nr:radical SAM protein [Actinocrinis sp.]HEV2347903.1 radical SAM protein [Actinocrinis sp.]
MARDITLLWALRSTCKFTCGYCYFGTIAAHRAEVPTAPGALSHLRRDDLTREEIFAFARSLDSSPVARVVIAGGEPLDWPHTLDLIATIKAAGCQVVIATNGIPLNKPAVAGRLVELGVDGVSVSLDSTDAAVNDELRPALGGYAAHGDVLSGIRTLIAARGEGPAPRVGIYSVVSRRTLNQIGALAELAVKLGCDYYVPQPVSLSPDHALDRELTPYGQEVDRVAAELTSLHTTGLPLALPGLHYTRLFIASITDRTPRRVEDCFGGAQLFFVQPNGSLWDCPSDLRIAATPPERRRTIKGADARTLFADRPACTDCALLGRDCVSMFPLVRSLPRMLRLEEVR